MNMENKYTPELIATSQFKFSIRFTSVYLHGKGKRLPNFFLI